MPRVLQRALERRGRDLPLLVGAGRVVRLRGEVGLVLGEAERRQDRGDEVQHPHDLGVELVRPAEQVRVVLREAAHAHEAVQHARALEPIDGAQLREAQRQLAVAAQLRVVDREVERAVHRLQLVRDVLDLDRRVHVRAVVLGVPGRLPQVQLGDVRAVDEVVAALEVPVAPVVLDLLADEPALGVPEDRARRPSRPPSRRGPARVPACGGRGAWPPPDDAGAGPAPPS